MISKQHKNCLIEVEKMTKKKLKAIIVLITSVIITLLIIAALIAVAIFAFPLIILLGTILVGWGIKTSFEWLIKNINYKKLAEKTGKHTKKVAEKIEEGTKIIKNSIDELKR